MIKKTIIESIMAVSMLLSVFFASEAMQVNAGDLSESMAVSAKNVPSSTEQNNCEHPIVDNLGVCTTCLTGNLEMAELEKKNGSKVSYTSLADAFTDAADGETVRLLRSCNAQGLQMSHYTELQNKAVIIDLNSLMLQIDEIDTENALTVMNGTFMGSIRHGANTGKLILKDLNGTISDLQWMPVAGVELINSRLKLNGYQFFVEKLNMDEASVFDINHRLSNYGSAKISDVEDALGGIREFLPYGFSIDQRRPYDGAADIYNTIIDTDDNIADNILLKYKKLTDASADIAIDASTFVYDGSEKIPNVTVSYDGEMLTKDVHYTVTYLNNVNAGKAGVKIEGLGVYHGVVEESFIINKAVLNAPEGIVAASGVKNGAGTITNVTETMEYSTNQTDWISVSGNTITGLADADYYIRYKETQNYSASPAVKVTIHTVNTEVSTSETETEVETEANGQKQRNTWVFVDKLEVSQSGKKIKITWGKVARASGYHVYIQYCGQEFDAKSLVDVKGQKTSVTVTTVGGKKLNLKKNYKICVKAYKNVDGRQVILGKTITVHIVGSKNSKNTKVKAIKLNKSSYQLKVGKSATIKAKAILEDKTKKPLSDVHTKDFRYISSNKKVARVSAKGKIKAVGKGTCTIYVYAKNGNVKKVKVIVK